MTDRPGDPDQRQAAVLAALADPLTYSPGVRAEADRLLSQLPDTGDRIRDRDSSIGMVAAALAAARADEKTRHDKLVTDLRALHRSWDSMLSDPDLSEADAGTIRTFLVDLRAVLDADR